MSIEKVRNAVDEFLKTDTPEVLAIKGGWGVGKTFFWNQFVQKTSKNHRYPFKRYTYVSLFGISSLEELKFTIFEQIIDKSQIGERISIDNLKRNADDLAKRLGRKAVQLLQGIPVLKNYGSAIQSASFLSVKDTLICFDDFERKGDRLSAKDVLGLVSLLKEQRDCKVVLIFNDTSLDQAAREDYKQFREKVIDLEITYSPTAKESGTLVFESQSHIDQTLANLAIKLDIRNIRILKKIEKAAKRVVAGLTDVEEEVTNQALSTLTLLGWCYYSHGEQIPSYDYVKKIGFGLYELGEKKKTEQEQGWDAMLRDYGFFHTDEYDLALADVIETGYVDETVLLEEAKKVNAQVLANKSQASFSGAWDLFHNTFDNNEDALIEALSQSLRKNASYISPINLNGTVRLLRELGKEELASELIGTYIETNKEKPKLFDLDSYAFSGDIDDKEVIAKFSTICNDIKEIKSLEDVLHSVAGKNGWGRSDEEILSSASEDDFYCVFKKQTGDHLRSYVDTCLQFGRFSNATEQQKEIAFKARKALTRIGQESKLNAIRVKKYGVIIEAGEAVEKEIA